MPHLAFDIDFCAQLSKLQGSVKQGVFDAWEKFERLTLDQLFKDQGLKLETLKRARETASGEAVAVLWRLPPAPWCGARSRSSPLA
ncbi:hypothetical protein ABZS61_11545 [Streptomyces sp. NPDC005566]|uniref:hypothetical protein n=1 Tax=Streptomyces sp. NPDC005566 TaxID=3156886 RepID=UPI0033B1CA4E